ncbi:3-hydroxy-2-methylbutyryl-CoA dehydrogenase [Desulfosarcina alkanivorans]|jgi:NAD(P)-dependent dehydrogenase (short-subunit alcohol dehydrogenase family)|uniref:3-hydroxy-2-methylbutyryl-CoA dehydrogenase n=1 Tax=Desulfosarcina alkanivorans TaxID=571177 RepID=A0A5K7YN12_9BACT|nr:SDR family NAD(P)-dependent oxidoreductase [Desulfosarcina alkanivorans]BBO69803.1 3-hydroxy-2-methylbutyryl-CoA dehydrogenase [Desulfosarcina alkanivorans]
MDLEGATIIVTGGASGLGEACIRQFVNKGATAAIFDLDEQRGKKIAAEVGDNALFCNTDVVDPGSVKASVNKVVDTFGAVHVVINCAGVGTPMKVIGKKGPMPMDRFSQVIMINLVGTMNVLSQAADKMLRNAPNADGEKGVVINTASVAAFEGQIGQAAYSASKAGVVGMTLPIAREFADYGIRVMTIAPGLFETPILAGLSENVKAALAETIPFPKRLGLPGEFAQLARQIIENPVLNGETIRLDAALRMAAR